tara:strand:- start:543 stop:731 length:189 start_codon:yes stop_codon:yes gene_type:complete
MGMADVEYLLEEKGVLFGRHNLAMPHASIALIIPQPMIAVPISIEPSMNRPPGQTLLIITRG